MTTNTSGISPTEYNVLVECREADTVTAGGIQLPDSVIARKQAMMTRATLIAVSPLAFTYERWPDGARPPQVGDTVIITKAAGVEVEGLDGKVYRMMKDKDIGAVIGGISELDALMDKAKDRAKVFQTLQGLNQDIEAENAEAAHG